MCAHCRPYRLVHHRPVIRFPLRRQDVKEFRHALRSLRHHACLSVCNRRIAARRLAVSHQKEFLVVSHRIEHLFQPVRHTPLWLFQCTFDCSAPFILRKTVIPWYHGLQHLLRVIANRPHQHHQFKSLYVPVAHTRFLSLIIHLPVLPYD